MDNYCPMLEKCEVNIDEGTAEHVCNGAWFSCRHASHLIPKKKPREWVTKSEEVKDK